MKEILTILLIFFSCSVFSQSDARLKTSLDFILMSKMLNSNELSDDLNKTSPIKLFQPINYIGISLTSRILINKRSSYEGSYIYDGYIEYLQIIPTQIKVLDSLEGKVNGFNFGLTLGGIDLLKNKKIDFITCFGFNTGRIWLNGDNLIKQKNPYFAPMVTIIPRVSIGHYSFQIRASYDYDISKKGWRRKGFSKSEMLDLKKFSSQGFNMSIGIGYAF